MKIKYDAEAYSIFIRKENIEGDFLYVARASEFSDLEEYGDTYEEAHKLILESISTAQDWALEEGRAFPAPKEVDDNAYSGRITLRFPKSLHKKLAESANGDGVSLNTYICALLSFEQGYINKLRDARCPKEQDDVKKHDEFIYSLISSSVQKNVTLNTKLEHLKVFSPKGSKNFFEEVDIVRNSSSVTQVKYVMH